MWCRSGAQAHRCRKCLSSSPDITWWLCSQQLFPGWEKRQSQGVEMPSSPLLLLFLLCSATCLKHPSVLCKSSRGEKKQRLSLDHPVHSLLAPRQTNHRCKSKQGYYWVPGIHLFWGWSIRAVLLARYDASWRVRALLYLTFLSTFSPLSPWNPLGFSLPPQWGSMARQAESTFRNISLFFQHCGAVLTQSILEASPRVTTGNVIGLRAEESSLNPYSTTYSRGPQANYLA